MKFLLKLLVAITSLIGIVLIIALFVDRSFEVKRTKIIPASQQVTFNYFKNLEHQEDFNVWLNYDPNTEIWYEGTPGEVGYKICWKSTDERVGVGQQEIVAFEEYKSIEYKIEMEEPEEIEGTITISIEEAGVHKSKVTWNMKGEIPYPWNLTLLFNDVEGRVGTEIENVLKKAQPLIEKSAG